MQQVSIVYTSKDVDEALWREVRRLNELGYLVFSHHILDLGPQKMISIIYGDRGLFGPKPG